MKITAIVSDRVITPTVDGTPVYGDGTDMLEVSMDAEFLAKEHHAAWFASGCNHVESIPLINGECAIPPLHAGTLRLTVEAWDDGDPTHLITARMMRGIKIERHGAHTYGELEPVVINTIERLENAISESREQVEEAIEAEQERVTEFAASQAERESQFSAAQASRENRFASEIQGFTNDFNDSFDSWEAAIIGEVEMAEAATSSANEAATAANNAADDLAQRVQAGEFNGAAFSIKYTPASIAAMQAITGMKQGEFACITSNVQDPDNAKLFMYGNGQWNYITDMSGATGIQGAQGVQGVSLEAVAMSGTKVSVTKYDPSTQQRTTSEVGDLAQPISSAVSANVDGKFLVVDAMPTDPVEGIVYMIRE